MFKKDAWKTVAKQAKKMQKTHMNDLFAEDKTRAKKYTKNIDKFLFADFSKNIFDAPTLDALIKLAEDAGLKQKIKDMFSGVKINQTENRAVLHTALRNLDNTPIFQDGVDIMPEINAVFAKMEKFVNKVHKEKKYKYIVNIGIGGSDLGPKMAVEALKSYHKDGMKAYFISNIDGTNAVETLKELNAEETLFIVASKTFTTIETLTNAKTCRKWLINKLGKNAVKDHFIALSTNAKEVEKFGIDTDNMFEFWDFIGGRYSMLSAIGISIALMIGWDKFNKIREGAHIVDKHFQTKKFEDNIPVLMALISIFYNEYFGFKSQAVIPYDAYLAYLPAYLQQLDMESNGKYITNDGKVIAHQTAQALFGGVGTDVQHSFFQMLHQGTTPIPTDFIMPAISHNEVGEHHKILISNFLAQSEALMKGRKSDVPHKCFLGNRPSNTFLFKKFGPKALGMTVALYEHKVFTQGVIWNIDSFDQWGVQLGKDLALDIYPEVCGNGIAKDHDSSTKNLLKTFIDFRK
ncbi:MAG: glucose-6-phosphate isomerase [Alphaproteobacteria bacterium]